MDRHKTNVVARLAPLALVAGLLGASCSGGSEGSETTTTPAPATIAPTAGAPTTTTAASSVTTAPVGPNMKPDEIAVRNLLDIFMYESTAAYESPDPNRAALLALLENPYKDYFVGELAKYRAEGTYFKRSGGSLPAHRTNTVEFSGDASAIAFECVVDDRLTYKKGSDQPVDTQIVRSSFQTTAVRGADGQWRISDSEAQTPSTTAGRCGGL